MPERDSRSLALSSVGDLAGPQPRADEEARSLWSLVDDRLRGRWRFAIVLAACLGAAFGAAGYLLTTPMYESTALIRIAPNISPILRDTPETGLMPRYESFVQTQVRLITSRYVLNWAVDNEALAALPWARQSGLVRRLERGLMVKADRGSELILVSFEADLPEVAPAVVNAVIDAYYELYASAGSDDIAFTLDQLRGIRRDLFALRSQKRAAVERLVSDSEFGVGDLGTLLSMKVMRLISLESDIRPLERSLELAPPGTSLAEEEAAEALQGPSLTDLAAVDVQLFTRLQTLEELRYQFELVKQRNLPSSKPYVRLEEQLRTAERGVQERETIARAAWEASPQSLGSSGNAAQELDRLNMMAEEVSAQIRSMRALQLDVQGIEAEIAGIEGDMAGVADRIEELQIESASVREERITIAARADQPLEPSQDRRRKLAAVGAMGGIGLGFGIFFVLGGIDRRAFDSSQLRDGRGPRCLGVLPDLGQGRLDDEANLVAAHCVHQIRNRLEALRAPGTSPVLCVSSPYQGDGKTSLAMALGWSYAAAGNRTILVDCDLSGQELTRHAALGDQPGLREILRHGMTNGQTSYPLTPNLDLVPVGIDAGFGAEVLRRRDLEAAFGGLRQDHDVVIVDTGPIPGSLEAVPAAAAADQVVLVVRRGRRTLGLEGSIDGLENVGASCVGMVLNGAAPSDCDRYAGRTSRSTAPADRAVVVAGEVERGVVTDNVLQRAMRAAARSDDQGPPQRDDPARNGT